MKILYQTLFPLLAIVLLLAGCGVIHIDADAKAYPVSEKAVPAYKAGQTITITNYYAKPEVVALMPKRVEGDLKQYTDTAIKLLEQGLNYRDIKVAAGGEKTVKLRVYNVKYEQATWTIRTDVNIGVEMGNGESFSVFHHNPSPGNGWRSVNGAITRATEKVLKHPKFVRYINE